MASPFKTAETMDLARMLQEEDSSCKSEKRESERDCDNLKRELDPSAFTNLVVTKDSSTELIATVEPAEKPAFMLRDLNAGRGQIDDDGKPAVGKVFSRVIQITGSDSKPKQLKARRSRKDDCTASRKESRERSSARPQSSGTNNGGFNADADFSGMCPTCHGQFSFEALKNHVALCRDANKES